MPGDDLRQSSIAILDVVAPTWPRCEKTNTTKRPPSLPIIIETQYEVIKPKALNTGVPECRTAFQGTVEDVVCQPPLSNFSALAMREQFQSRGCSSTL
ncbi:hypothetical protein CCUS01_11887 [Colletotrichum cuscutae]|uniref:Uncharacterized protein n=1 Tax=Colletotrichum cuscutae TaxID=1209917 RepID=A0AAI9TY63_9PEZI|nr:hypothetical protein CCUS01_11887 [Colletotrichum cuscutae]